MGKVFLCYTEFFIARCLWERQVVWEKFNCIRDSVGLGIGVIAGIILIVFQGWAYVVTEGALISPSQLVSSSAMNDDLAAWGR